MGDRGMNDRLTLVATGLSHNTASLSVRERAALTAEDLPGALQHLSSKVGNGVVVSTCNRTEVYVVADTRDAGLPQALDLFLGATGVRHPRIEDHTYYFRDEDAVRHLHRVACGMDSMVLGEVEILRQVRAAMNASFEAGLLTSVHDRLFHSALRAGRRIHANTYIGRHDRSVAAAALTMAKRALGKLADKRMLVIGAGHAATMAVRAMLHEGATGIRIVNRTHERAVKLAEHTGATAVPIEQLPEALAEADLVICVASSSVLSRESLKGILRARRDRVLVIGDLGVPRNVDPAVRGLPGVHLFDMDDLMTLCPSTPEDRERDIAHAQAILEDEVTRFLLWWRSSHAVPTIAALEEAVEAARQREIAKTLRRLPSFDEDQRQALDALTKALVKKVLHRPITRLKLHGDDSAYIALGRELFGLESTRGRSAAAGEQAPVVKEARLLAASDDGVDGECA